MGLGASRTPEKRDSRPAFALQTDYFLVARSAGLEPATFSVRSHSPSGTGRDTQLRSELRSKSMLGNATSLGA
jgi:hypothetical protein